MSHQLPLPFPFFTPSPSYSHHWSFLPSSPCFFLLPLPESSLFFLSFISLFPFSVYFIYYFPNAFLPSFPPVTFFFSLSRVPAFLSHPLFSYLSLFPLPLSPLSHLVFIPCLSSSCGVFCISPLYVFLDSFLSSLPFNSFLSPSFPASSSSSPFQNLLFVIPFLFLSIPCAHFPTSFLTKPFPRSLPFSCFPAVLFLFLPLRCFPPQHP